MKSRNSMKTIENQSKTQKFNDNPWKSIEIKGIGNKLK